MSIKQVAAMPAILAIAASISVVPPSHAAVFRHCGSLTFTSTTTNQPHVVIGSLRTRNTKCQEARGFVRRWQARSEVPTRLLGWRLISGDTQPVRYTRGGQRLSFTAVAID